jgi:hypothetical protein
MATLDPAAYDELWSLGVMIFSQAGSHEQPAQSFIKPQCLCNGHFESYRHHFLLPLYANCLIFYQDVH